jgi:hypothetical protein
VCPVQRDAEEEAAGEVGEALDLVDGRQRPDVTGCGAAGGNGEDVLDVGGVGLSDGRQDVRGHEGGAHDEEVAGGEHQVAEKPEGSVAADLAQVHAGDTSQRQRAHQDLERVPDDELGRGDGDDVHMRVIDVDADEDRSRGRGADARGLGETGSRDRHGRVPSSLGWSSRW